MQDIQAHVASVCRAAKEASRGFGSTSTAKKNALLCAMADQLTADSKAILAANAEDLATAAENGVPKTMLDRLKLDEKRLSGICAALREVAALPDPIGSGEQTVRPNGLVIRHIRAPMGCVAMIYEARPNVTVVLKKVIGSRLVFVSIPRIQVSHSAKMGVPIGQTSVFTVTQRFLLVRQKLFMFSNIPLMRIPTR